MPISTILTAALLSVEALASSAPSIASGPLYTEIASLDAKVFDAYNRCDLDTFSRYFDPAVAFYHDTGGATFDRATVIANTKKYICGNVRRELLPNTLYVYPIKDYGAIEEGEHQFCELTTGACEGIAKFVIVWARHDGQWQITNVLSYGHRAITDADHRNATPGN